MAIKSPETQKLFNYISTMKDIELLKYRQEQASSLCGYKIRTNTELLSQKEQENVGFSRAKGAVPQSIFYSIAAIATCLLIGATMGFLISIVYMFIENGIWDALWHVDCELYIFTGLKYGIIISGIIGIIVAFFLTYDTITSQKDYNTRIENEAREKNIQINERNKQIVNNKIFAKKQIAVYKKEKDIINIDYKKICHLRDKYYSLNKIYPKYRNLVCICMIYEYFDSGICNTLEGPYGAYARLENDLKYVSIENQLNTMNNKLDTIIRKLDQVIDNQHALNDALYDCNRKLSRLDSSLTSLATSTANVDQKLSSIEYNTEVTAQFTVLSTMYDIYRN